MVAILWVAKSNRGGSVIAMIFHAFSSTAKLRFSPLISTFDRFIYFFNIYQASHKLEFHFNASGKASKASTLVNNVLLSALKKKNTKKSIYFILLLLQMP